MDPSKKKRARGDGDDNLSGDEGLRCDCCCNFIILSDDNHIQNNPCGHIVCFLCVVKSNMKRAGPAYCQVIDCSQKYIISCQYFNSGIPGEIIENETIVELGIDDVASILSFLPLKEIMPKRRVNMTWKEAVKKTIVPTSNNSYFSVESVEKFNAMGVMTTELPNLQQISIGYPGDGYKYNDGEDPDEDWAAERANWATHNIEIISNFSKLRELTIETGCMNGRYPFLFNSFPLLQKLNIKYCCALKWDLEMLAGLPSLKELFCIYNSDMTGNISSLGVLRDTLQKVVIFDSSLVEGNFMDLADFPHLKELNLQCTGVTGDIRDIGENDFSSLEKLTLPKGVYGGVGYDFQRISDAPDVARAVYLLKKQRPTLTIPETWYSILSEDSPDWYASVDEDESPPFLIRFVKAGSRFGYRWETNYDRSCEVNWLDPAPDRESNDYVKYLEELREIESDVTVFRGFHQPPTEEEYNSIWQGNAEEIDE